MVGLWIVAGLWVGVTWVMWVTSREESHKGVWFFLLTVPTIPAGLAGTLPPAWQAREASRHRRSMGRQSALH